MSVTQALVAQRTMAGGSHTAELVQPCAANGIERGYITRRAGTVAVFGCTCGEWFEGPAEAATERFEAHVAALTDD